MDVQEPSWECSGDHSAHNNLWWVGILLDAVATLAGTAGKQLLRFAVITKNPIYYPIGLLCTAVVDPAFDISAYGFAAQSIIAPCAGMVVVWNVMLAPWTLGEQLTRSRKIGGCLICLGTICVGIFGNHNDCKRTIDEYLLLFARPAACCYYFLFVLWTLICLHFYRSGSPTVSGFFVGAYGGALAGNMFTTKAVVEMFKCVAATGAVVVVAAAADGVGLMLGEPPAPPASPLASECSSNPFFGAYPYIFISISLALACASLYLLAVGLRTFEALYMITIFEGFMIISGAISGNIVLNEKAGQSAGSLLAYSASIGLILCGLSVLCAGEKRPGCEDVTQMMDLANDAGLNEGVDKTRVKDAKRGTDRSVLVLPVE